MTGRAPMAAGGPERRVRWRRVLGVAATWVVVIAVGRAVVPSASRAQDSAWGDSEQGALVGSLVSTDYVVRITATAAGPRYTVSTLSGQVLRANLNAAALARAFPHLDPANLRATPDGARPVGALMQVDTGERPQD